MPGFLERPQPYNANLTALAAVTPTAEGLALLGSSFVPGTIATQAANSVAITGGTISGLTALEMVSGAGTPEFQLVGSSSYSGLGISATGGTLNFIAGGSASATLAGGAFVATTLRAGTSGTIGFSTDVVLVRDAANTLAQRNSTNAQAFYIYNTYTDASNYERGFLRWNASTLQIGTDAAGTGSARDIRFATNGTSRWRISSSGHLLAHADNTYDIGASGDTRPRNVYVGSLVEIAAAGVLRFTSSSRIEAPSNGNLVVRNAAQTDFGLFQLGGTTSSFPALKRNATALNVRLADDSADAPLTCSNLTASGQVLSSDGSASTPSLSFTNFTNTGLAATSGNLWFSAAGTYYVRLLNVGFQLRSSTGIHWASGNVGTSSDLSLERDAAGVLALRSGTDPQTFRVYNTYTNSSNYERGLASWASNVFVVGAEAAGTGSLRSMRLRGASITFVTGATEGAATTRWQIDSNGHFLANLDNTYDIGASGAARPRTGYFGTSLLVGASGHIRLNEHSVGSPAFTAGRLQIYNSESATNPFEIYTSEDAINTSTQATYIVPHAGSTRLFFGVSGRAYYALNLANVGQIESMPTFLTTDGMQWGAINSNCIFRSSFGSGVQTIYSASSGATSAHSWHGTASGFTSPADANLLMRLTTGRALQLYNTHTDSSNYERLGINWASNVCTITTEKAGTGTQRDLVLSAAFETGIRLASDGNIFILTGLPLSDPAVQGQLWNNSGTLMISEG